MFKWFNKAIARGIKAEMDKEFFKTILIETLNDEETQKFIVEFTDTLYDRYRQKVLGTLGKMQAVTNSTGEVMMPNLFNKKGQLDLKALLPMVLGGFGQKQAQTQQSQSSNSRMTID